MISKEVDATHTFTLLMHIKYNKKIFKGMKSTSACITFQMPQLKTPKNPIVQYKTKKHNRLKQFNITYCKNLWNCFVIEYTFTVSCQYEHFVLLEIRHLV